jgi:uncharacterized protein YbjT (DUF2867 family)
VRKVFISGGTGYIGRALVERLIAAGHRVSVLARPGSEGKVVSGAETIPGNALDWASFAEHVEGCDTFVHLTGVGHPAPWKSHAFRAIDLTSLRASVRAAKSAGVAHFVYVSVAQPAPVMKEYVRVRQECEQILRDADIQSTILRPWYVLGPGHRWPVILKPFYTVAEALGSKSAYRLGLVTQAQMVSALVWAVEHPTSGTRLLDVPAIRARS